MWLRQDEGTEIPSSLSRPISMTRSGRCNASFNQDRSVLTEWDVGNVTDMGYMFWGATGYATSMRKRPSWYKGGEFLIIT